MRPRRAFLYVPGNDDHKLRKAAGLGADCVCIDLEDGVALSQKLQARFTAAQALRELDFQKSERLVRINSVGSGFESEDIAGIVPAHPDAVVVPKVNEALEIYQISKQIAEIEASEGWQKGAIRLVVMIETAKAIINLPQIAGSDPRIEALIFGAEDLAADIGALRTRTGWEVFHARSSVVTCAAAFQVQAIDLLDTDFKNLDRLREEARLGAELGFAGKQVIHPNQIKPVQEAFTPSAEAIAEALRIIAAANEHEVEGVGAFALDGRMVDRPIIKAAERVVELARAAGALES